MIVIVDYGLGNLSSIQNMIKKIGYSSVISSDVETIGKADKIILPGVGAFDEGIRNIDSRGMRDILVHKATVEKVPFLGICLGMHLMTGGSEEGSLQGLSIVSGTTKKFPSMIHSEKLRTPHIGWNYVKVKNDTRLTEGFDDEFRFYFVHSYYVELQNVSETLLSSEYGVNFTAGYTTGNIMGVQFHPEKSHKFGKKLLENFVQNF